MNLDFSSADEQFRGEVRAWLQDNRPRQARPAHGQAMLDFDRAWMQRQFEAGWAGIAWPREYGGRGLSLVQQMIWFEEYARAGCPPIGCYYVALNHGGPTLIAHGTEAQKTEHLPKILSGEAVWCQGFSEPGAGSDLASLRCKAEIDGDHLVVTGQKIWTTFGQYARYQELLVRTDPALARHRGISWVICDMESPGIEVRPIPCIDGTAHFCEVFYDEVRIPLSNVVGELNGGWRIAMATLGFERGTGLLYDQIEMSRLVDEFVAEARRRPGPDGVRAAIHDDVVASRLALLKAEVAALRAMSYASISRAGREGQLGAEGTLVALYTAEIMQKVYRVGLDLLGTEGIELPSAHSAQYQYLNSYMYTIGGGTSEIRRNIIGERVLGLPR